MWGNPFKEQKPLNNTNGTATERKPFELTDLQILYEALSVRAETENLKDKALFDAFMIALFTGARREEIGKLKIRDVNIHKGNTIPTINIHNAKTYAGTRSIPIHPSIIDILKVRTEQSPDPNCFVFNELSSNKDGLRMDAIGKRFGRLKEALGFGPDYVFHSIRKSFTTFLEQAGVTEGVTADIVGHEKQTITYGLYSGGSSDMQKYEAIKKLPFNFVNKGH